MQLLVPYQESSNCELSAELSMRGPFISIEYHLEIESPLLNVPSTSAMWQPKQVPRADELWKSTCFEAFLKPADQDRYYEFNFSLKPAWNLYVFDSYRNPQPPQPSEDFTFEGMVWQAKQGRLVIQLENKTDFTEFTVGLTAVLEDEARAKHYHALTHAEEKPDFHSAKSFTMLRKTDRDAHKGIKK